MDGGGRVIRGARQKQALDAAAGPADIDRRLTRGQIVGQLVALGDVASVAQRDVAEYPNLVLGLVIDGAVARRGLGLREDSDGTGAV